MVERERERDAELRKGRSELRYVSITEGEKGRPTLKMLVYTLHPSLYFTHSLSSFSAIEKHSTAAVGCPR